MTLSYSEQVSSAVAPLFFPQVLTALWPFLQPSPSGSFRASSPSARHSPERPTRPWCRRRSCGWWAVTPSTTAPSRWFLSKQHSNGIMLLLCFRVRGKKCVDKHRCAPFRQTQLYSCLHAHALYWPFFTITESTRWNADPVLIFTSHGLSSHWMRRKCCWLINVSVMQVPSENLNPLCDNCFPLGRVQCKRTHPLSRSM